MLLGVSGCADNSNEIPEFITNNLWKSASIENIEEKGFVLSEESEETKSAHYRKETNYFGRKIQYGYIIDTQSDEVRCLSIHFDTEKDTIDSVEKLYKKISAQYDDLGTYNYGITYSDHNFDQGEEFTKSEDVIKYINEEKEQMSCSAEWLINDNFVKVNIWVINLDAEDKIVDINVLIRDHSIKDDELLSEYKQATEPATIVGDEKKRNFTDDLNSGLHQYDDELSKLEAEQKAIQDEIDEIIRGLD